jgi:hypothetical protein
MNSPESDNFLSRIVRDWRVAPPRDPQFRATVWTRISAARREGSWGSYAKAHAILVGATLAVALMAGGWIGREQARAQAEADRAAIVTAYVRGLDARTMHAP